MLSSRPGKSLLAALFMSASIPLQAQPKRNWYDPLAGYRIPHSVKPTHTGKALARRLRATNRTLDQWAHNMIPETPRKA